MSTPIHRNTGFAFSSVREMAEAFEGRLPHCIYSRYNVPNLREPEAAMVPAVSSHSRLSPEQRRQAGIGDGLIRLSTGIEDSAGIIGDLDQTLR